MLIDLILTVCRVVRRTGENGRVAALLAVAVSVITVQARAAEPMAAMVMAVSGPIGMQVTPMTEIAAGTVLRLNPTAEVTFLHYSRCKLVTVVGGVLTITNAEYESQGGAVSEKSGPCPQIRVLTRNGGSAGGLVMRSSGEIERWPVDARIAVVGHAAGNARDAVVYSGNQVVLRFDGFLGTALNLATKGQLTPEANYSLHLFGDGRMELIEIPFIAAAPNGGDSLIVLHID